jgi:hypothetical protein
MREGPVTFQTRVASLRALQGHDPFEANLLAIPVLVRSAVVTSHPGANKTYLTVLADGVTSFHKPFAGVNPTLARAFGHTVNDPPVHECAAWRLAAAVGGPFTELVPPCVLREIDSEWGSLSLGIAGVPVSVAPFNTATDQVEAAAFFDCLIGQQDRHAANYRWDAGPHRLWLIDHGFCFPRPGDRLNESVFVRFRWRRTRQQLTPSERGHLTTLLASPDLHGLSTILEPPREAALRERARRMLATGAILLAGDF